MKRPLRWAGWLLAAALAGYVILFGWVWRESRLDQRKPADAIVVLGAAQYNGRPSPVLKARLDHAIALYVEGLAGVVVVTGGIGTGDRVSEASVGHRYLRTHMVPDSAIIVRPDGRTTEESIHSVAEWMHEREFSRALLVSDPFHMARLRLEARHAGLTPESSPTQTSPIVPGSRKEAGYLAVEALKFPIAALRALLGHRSSAVEP
ncbi:MAG TPA: YdcF family protein [Gemmatimonadales bacterium]|nr:YdcF family protein [Gemmatimonadales bacterium]